MAAGEADLLVPLLTSGDDDGLETTVLVARDDCDGRLARWGEEAGVVAAVEGGDAEGDDFSTECDFRTSLLARTGSGPPLTALFVGEAVGVALSFSVTVSGLECGALPDFWRRRRRSVDEGPGIIDGIWVSVLAFSRASNDRLKSFLRSH